MVDFQWNPLWAVELGGFDSVEPLQSVSTMYDLGVFAVSMMGPGQFDFGCAPILFLPVKSLP